MTLIRKLSAIAIALTIAFASTAMADKKILDVIVPEGQTTSTWGQGVMLHNALKAKGYDTNLVHTANCHKNNKYIANADRPGFFFKSGAAWISDVLDKKCLMAPEANENSVKFLTPYFYRSNAMCVRKSDGIGSNLKDIIAWIKAKDRVTIGTFNNLPDDFADLGKQFGNKWKKVAYNGSSNTLKGFLAGDTDLMYLGYTAREINTPDLHCFATTGGVNGTEKFADLFPSWALSTLVEFPSAFAVKHESEKQLADTTAVIHEILANDPALVKYYGTAHIPTGKVLAERGLTLDDWWADASSWTPGGATDAQMKAWKSGKLK